MPKQSKRASNQADFLYALIRTAYLPTEIPPIVTTKQYAEFCRTNFTSLKSQSSRLGRLSTDYDTYTAPKTTSGRRNLAVVQPLAQLGISLLITQHCSRIRRIITAKGTSLYRVDEDRKNNKAFNGLDFRAWDSLLPHLYSEKKYFLAADISRFFYTIYTHSIPWAVLGKKKAKQWRVHRPARLRNHWSNSFDLALQACHSRETFGIPVGPDTSRIVAEILLAGIEADPDIIDLFPKSHSVRLLDDFVVGFDDQASAYKALAALRRVLWSYNLQLNEEKTSVRASSEIFKDRWKIEFELIRVSEADARQQESDIYGLVDFALHCCLTYHTSAPANWACRRLSEIRKNVDNFRIIVDAMFRLARDFPSCLAHVAAFLINNQAKCKHLDLAARMTDWVRGNLRDHLASSHDFEVSWSLLVAGVMRIKISKDDLDSTRQTPSSVVFAILGLLRERGLLTLPLSSWDWRAELKNDGGVLGKNWLPAYEAARRRWTRDSKIVASVQGDPILAQMLARRVTFLDDDIFDAARIDITRRRYRKAKTPTMIPTTGVEETELAPQELDEDWSDLGLTDYF